MATNTFGTINAPSTVSNTVTQIGTANTLAAYTSSGGLTATGVVQGSNISATATVAGTNTGDVTLGTADGLSLSGQILSLAAASGSQTGALLSTDWTTFNNKQSALTFSGSLINTTGTVTLVNDNATPGNMYYYGTNSSGVKGFFTLPAASGGTVTSVALAAPTFLTVSGSPVTTSGTLTLALATQTANTVFAGPVSGAAAAPTFRALTPTDVPTPAVAATATAAAINTAYYSGSSTVSMSLPAPSSIAAGQQATIQFYNNGTGAITITGAVYYGNSLSTTNAALVGRGTYVILSANSTDSNWYSSTISGTVSVN